MKPYILTLCLMLSSSVLASSQVKALTLGFNAKGCGQCSKVIQHHLQRFPGITKVQGMTIKDRVKVHYQSDVTTPLIILQQLLEIGFITKLIVS